MDLSQQVQPGLVKPVVMRHLHASPGTNWWKNHRSPDYITAFMCPLVSSATMRKPIYQTNHEHIQIDDVSERKL